MELIETIVGLAALATFGAVATAIRTLLAWLRVGERKVPHAVFLEIDGKRVALEGESVGDLERSFHARIVDAGTARASEPPCADAV